jgi:hypothetical protein
MMLAAIVLSSFGGWPAVATNSCWGDDPVQQRDDQEPQKETPLEIARKQKAYAGLAALAGIAIVGVCLGALTILWAGRLRRQLRQPLPEGTASAREFWFLKPPKPTVGESSLPDSHQPPHEPHPTEPS